MGEGRRRPPQALGLASSSGERGHPEGGEEVNVLRVYFDPDEIGLDGYPYAWKKIAPDAVITGDPSGKKIGIKDLIRHADGHRCLRCKHPFVVGESPGEWSPCDELCTHGEPIRVKNEVVDGGRIKIWREAQWRILTVHHLNGIKHDCRWWNLVSLCQRCHLVIQGKVYMDRPWVYEHSEWFKPYAAGYYAWRHLGEELNRAEVMARLEELLALEDRQLEL